MDGRRSTAFAITATWLLGVACASGASGASGASRPPVLVIAHRGASGYRPEHTLAAYELAIDQGADYVEPDVVVTKDGVLVARHENEIGATTDAAVKFPDRKAAKVVDGRRVEGWFVEDFTLAEVKTLRARERLPGRSRAFDGRFAVPTLEEVLALVERRRRETGRTVGVYPETKHPTYFRDLGLPIEERLLAALEAHGLTRPTDPVFVQSFETGNLRWLRARTGVRLVQLLDDHGRPFDLERAGDPRTYADLATPAGLKEIATYADAIGPSKRLVVPADSSGALRPPTRLVEDAHAAGLLVHVWTLRSDSAELAPDYHGDPAAEYRQLVALGVDGIFGDFPDVGVRATRGAGPGSARR